MKKRSILALLLIAGLLSACVAMHSPSMMPVIIRAEDLVGRSYERLGTVQLSRERIGAEVLSADDYVWAHTALQEEARKIGADAILQPEVNISANSFVVIPYTEIKARATAIRFR